MIMVTLPYCFVCQAGDEGIEDVSLSGASVTMSQAASVADSASSMATAGLQVRQVHALSVVARHAECAASSELNY